jgi:hexosaminidase
MKTGSMKKLFFFALILFLIPHPSGSQDCNIIPTPIHFQKLSGEFNIKSSSLIVAPGTLGNIAGLFAESVSDIIGSKLKVTTKGEKSGNIFLKLDKSISNIEGYELKVDTSHIEIIASTEAGIYYGLQTLHQLLILSGKGQLPSQSIKDSPRFTWRGVMLDVSRTFMPVNLVKRYIDLFSQYKLNVVHLHLTDDQGWRIEIKRYPLLTEVGSKFDPKYNTMGGFYSQDDIRDLVRYAQLRNVTLVPEIELPGHACAALAAYPWLSCAGIRPEIHTFFEGPGVHKEIFCAGRPEVYEFIFNVLDEIIALFPSEYIHIGGDEAPKEEWKKCGYCQKTIKENNLNNEEELQSYFVKRIGEHLRSKNRILIGWDEIYDGGKLKGDEVLMFWRGWKAESIEKAVSAGFKIVATPTTHCYFDYDYEKIDTRKIFGYEPVPAAASTETAGNYIGVQANFWSHIDRSEYNIDKQLFPRVLGLAETAWTAPGNRNWESFKIAAVINSEYLKSKHINVYNDDSLK